MSIRLSVDIGGTFTDVVLDVHGELTTTKTLTTYDDPAKGVLIGAHQVMSAAGVVPEQIELVLHGTTLATNALIERNGARTGLLTTAGHRDVLEMAWENRFEQYDVNIVRPQPLVERALRLGVAERIASNGDVLLALDESEAIAAIDTLLDADVGAIAVGFLHSYVNARHEQRIAELIQQRCQARAQSVAVSLSSAVCPEIREYERLSTTVANAYVQPLMDQYLASLAQRLAEAGVGAQILLMTSGGGLTTLQTARRYPIRLVESGPAGGAMLASATAQALQLDHVVSFDMGGTTAKICLIDQGQPNHSRAFEVDRSYRFKKGSGLPVRIPVVEMVEIGAGGGSIASVDRLRRVQVGPESASSEPGPACYGQGGRKPTVTDADVVLGKLVPEFFAGGSMELDVAAASHALEEGFATLALEAEAAARAVCEIVDENMASASRAHAAEWGSALAGRCMLAFGGAAPLHAISLAQKLKIRRVLIPHGAGVGSAIGFLLAPVRFEVVRSVVTPLSTLQPENVQALLGQMRAEAAAVLDASQQAGARIEQVYAYMRYVGQGYEIAVPVAELSAQPEAARLQLRQAFDAAYTRLYSRPIPDMEVEILSWTLALATQTTAPAEVTLERDVSETVPIGEQVWTLDGQAQRAALYQRDGLLVGSAFAGPALLVEAQTTTVIPAGWHAQVVPGGHVLLECSDEP